MVPQFQPTDMSVRKDERQMVPLYLSRSLIKPAYFFKPLIPGDERPIDKITFFRDNFSTFNYQIIVGVFENKVQKFELVFCKILYQLSGRLWLFCPH